MRKSGNLRGALVLLVICGVIRVELKAIEGHEGHEGHGEVPWDENSEEVSGSEEVVHLKSYGEDCEGVEIKCVEGLVCAEPAGKCDCRPEWKYDNATEKCVELPTLKSLEENSLEVDEKTTVKPPAPEAEKHDDHVDGTVTHDEHEHNLELSEEDYPHSEEDHVNEHEHHEEMHHGRVFGKDDHSKSNHIHHEKKCGNCAEQLGILSRCNEETGTCECHDTESRPVVLLNGVCHINRKINDSCSTHEECRATIKGRSWCHMDIATEARYCQCEMFNYFDEGLEECLKFGSGLDSDCKTDLQCTGLVPGQGMGRSALCSRDTGRCVCKLGPNGEKGFLHEGNCFYNLKMGDSCETTKECQHSMPNQDVECSATSKTCSCRLDGLDGCLLHKESHEDSMTLEDHNHVGVGSRSMEGAQEEREETDSLKSATGLSTPNFVFIMIICAVVICAIVIVSVFVLKKRHRYSVVKQRETAAAEQSS